jgi:predicted ATPase/DNA-binding SARP family transcriptional activator
MALERDGTTAALTLPSKSLALLIMLAAHHDRVLQREWVAQRLWPDDDPGNARANLRRHLHLITKVLGDDALSLTRQTAAWAPRSPVLLDVVAFDRAYASSPSEAVKYYGGDLGAGLSDEIVYELRDAYAERYTAALRILCVQARQSGDDDALLYALQHLCAHDRFDEAAACELMSVRHRCGDRAGALRDFAALTTRLKSELDVEPQPETLDLHRRILAEIGAPYTPNNLPRSAVSFVGREHELESASFSVRAKRLISITGTGGIGKTSLAVQCATAQLRHFRDGVWFVDLASARDETDVYERIAAACGMAPPREQIATALEEFLCQRSTLFVFDNCERVAAPVRDVAQRLLSKTSVHIIVTSRRRLDTAGEIVLKLEPLAVPALDAPPSELVRYASVRLFLERAASMAPDLRVRHENAHAFAEIVRRLDGLPLALELVAARANLLTIDGIAKRLRDSAVAFRSRRDDEPRHRTIETATAWSYEILSHAEREVLQACSVFSGPWTLEALEAVLADDLRDGFEELSELIEGSLVHTQDSRELRYRLLETTRDFARKKLQESGDLVRRQLAHAGYYANFVNRLREFAEGSREAEYYLAIDAHYANVRAALEFAVENDAALAVRIIGGLYPYWTLRGRLQEGWSAARACEARGVGHLPAPLRGTFYQACGVIARELGEHDRSDTYLTAALECYRESGNLQGEADAVWAQAKLFFNTGRWARSKELYELCLVLQERLGDEYRHASTLANIGAIAHTMNDLAEAERMYRMALSEYERLGYLRGLAFLYRQLSLFEQHVGKLDESISSARRSVAFSAEIGDTLREADALVTLANALIESRRLEESIDALVRALEILERANHAQFLMLATEALARTAQMMGRSTDAIRFRARASALRRQKRLVLSPTYEREVTDEVAMLRTALPEEIFSAAWAAGGQMTGAQALHAARVIKESAASSGAPVAS